MWLSEMRTTAHNSALFNCTRPATLKLVGSCVGAGATNVMLAPCLHLVCVYMCAHMCAHERPRCVPQVYEERRLIKETMVAASSGRMSEVQLAGMSPFLTPPSMCCFQEMECAEKVGAAQRQDGLWVWDRCVCARMVGDRRQGASGVAVGGSEAGKKGAGWLRLRGGRPAVVLCGQSGATAPGAFIITSAFVPSWPAKLSTLQPRVCVPDVTSLPILPLPIWPCPLPAVHLRLQLYLNLLKERSTRCLLCCFFFGRLLAPVQLARLAVTSYPHFPVCAVMYCAALCCAMHDNPVVISAHVRLAVSVGVPAPHFCRARSG